MSAWKIAIQNILGKQHMPCEVQDLFAICDYVYRIYNHIYHACHIMPKKNGLNSNSFLTLLKKASIFLVVSELDIALFHKIKFS
jgi:hypothetical protein